VIGEVDEALRALIRRDVLAGAEIDVVLDAPTKDWAARRNAPTIDLYLYDLREDLRRRERGQVNEYDERGRVVGRHLPPRWFKLSYLVTAWTQRPEDEHRLLSALMACFLRQDAVPADLLGSDPEGLRLETAPVALSVGLPPPEDRGFADVWSALGGELKPSLDVVVVVPVETGQTRPVGPPVSKPPVVRVEGLGRDGADLGMETFTRRRAPLDLGPLVPPQPPQPPPEDD
jgi:Pvc16 N-terminal domain